MSWMRCQETPRRMRRVVMWLGVCGLMLPGSVSRAQNSGQAVQTARDFFDALDSGDINAVARYWSGDLSQFRTVVPTRSRSFGSRWVGDHGVRAILYAQGKGALQIVALKARYARATLTQTAYMTCTANQCRVTGYREGP